MLSGPQTGIVPYSSRYTLSEFGILHSSQVTIAITAEETPFPLPSGILIILARHRSEPHLHVTAYDFIFMSIAPFRYLVRNITPGMKSHSLHPSAPV